MGYNFPAGPTVGQVFGAYTWDGEKWKVSAAGTGTYALVVSDTPPVGAPANTLWWESDTGLLYIQFNDGSSTQWVAVSSGSSQSVAKNYIINGAMQISQEWGTTVLNVTNNYPVDQFVVQHLQAGTLGYLQHASRTPAGSPYRLRCVVTVADAAVGATDYVAITTKLEGQRIADLLFGTAAAKAITLRFGVRAPAGTYCVVIRNAASTRTWLAEYVISASEANVDTVKTITVPGDTTGTWAIDNTSGIEVIWSLMVGANYHNVSGAWIAAISMLGTSNQFNLMGTINNVFELFDVGLYAGSVAPTYVVPDVAAELDLCMRYFERGGSNMNYRSGGTFQAGIVQAIDTIRYAVGKRAAATLSFAGWQYYNTTDSFIAVTPSMYAGTPDQFQINGSSMTNYKAWAAGGSWSANARL